MQGISIIIPTYNGIDLLKQCLPLVIEEVNSYTGECEIIVVDDGSTDGTAQHLHDQFPQVQVLCRERNGGFSRSVNAGVLQSGFPLLLLLNNDIEISHPLLGPLSSEFREPDLFAVQPKMVTGSGDTGDYRTVIVRKPGFLHYRYEKIAPSPDRPVRMDFVSGGCSMFDRSKFMALGMFDERFSPVYFEDIDICQRAAYAGWKMLGRHDLIVYHRHPAATVSRTYSRFVRNFVHKKNYFIFLFKHLRSCKAPWLFPIVIPSYVLGKLLCGKGAFLVGFVAALREYFFQRQQPEEK
jgi:GT2 family glycosyltransferase